MTSSLMSMLPLVLMFVVLYFVMIRPQMKKQKEHRAMIDALAKGDEVVTAGGLLGKVAKLGDSNLGLEIANGVEVQRGSGNVFADLGLPDADKLKIKSGPSGVQLKYFCA